MSVHNFASAVRAGAAGAGGTSGFYEYQIEHSVRGDGTSGDDYTLKKTSVGTPTNNDKGTLSAWVKRTEINTGGDFNAWFYGGTGNTQFDMINFDGDDKIRVQGQRGGTSYGHKSVGIFRDDTAFYHIVVVFDSAQSTANDRVKVYVNGNLIDTSGTHGSGHYPQNEDFKFNTSGTTQYVLGTESYYGVYNFNGYMAEAIFADGQAYAPTQFAETKNGMWVPKDPTGTTFGNNGFHLKFGNSGSLGTDSSGNGNNFTTGMGADHQVVDSPTFGS